MIKTRLWWIVTLQEGTEMTMTRLLWEETYVDDSGVVGSNLVSNVWS
jgi:hypothetical protein